MFNTNNDGSIIEYGVLDKQDVLGAKDVFLEQAAALSVRAKEKMKCYRLSYDGYRSYLRPYLLKLQAMHTVYEKFQRRQI